MSSCKVFYQPAGKDYLMANTIGGLPKTSTSLPNRPAEEVWRDEQSRGLITGALTGIGLASDKAAFITGQIIRINGGKTAS
jgi:hypothetical protein